MNIQNKIMTIVQELIAHPSTTGTDKEKGVEEYIYSFLSALPYFQENPQFCGLLPISDDPFGRSILFGLVRGKTDNTVVLLNHHDVVSTECYGSLEPYAYDAQAITGLLAQKDNAAAADFASGQWLGGRGSCDMKGGMAAQLAYLEEYSAHPTEGSLLFLSVADEESYSAGMRQGITFLTQAKAKWNLDYTLAVNCEPNRRLQGVQTVSVGSVGKLLATVLIQGKTTHIGEYTSGLNPLGILAGLITETEGLPSCQESYKGEHTIPPVWLQARDQKFSYDVSTPGRASGYCSFQSFRRGPQEFMDLLKDSLAKVKSQFQEAQPLAEDLPIYGFAEFLESVSKQPGFEKWQASLKERLQSELTAGRLNYPEATLYYLNALLDFSNNQNPLALIAFAPPYYPATNSNLMKRGYFPKILAALEAVQNVRFEEYFLGVSDCSYLGNTLELNDDTSFAPNAPLWGTSYSFCQEALGSLQIPFLLLGPWGKDLHQTTERVNIPSLTQELPLALDAVIKAAWQC